MPQIKLRVYSVSTIGLSKYTRENLKQYGTSGLGVGVSLDTKYLKIPTFNLAGTVSINKNFTDGDKTAEGESSSNYYMAYGVTGSFSKSNWTFVSHFMFYQYFKYVSDESSETLYQFQDLGYQFNPSQSVGIGHSNRMGFYDENSGAPNFRIVNASSSYFYVRYTHSF